MSQRVDDRGNRIRIFERLQCWPPSGWAFITERPRLKRLVAISMCMTSRPAGGAIGIRPITKTSARCILCLRYAALIGGILSVVIRGELQEPGLQIFANTHTYNLFVTSHGLVMTFFTLMPALIGGFGN